MNVFMGNLTSPAFEIWAEQPSMSQSTLNIRKGQLPQ